MQKAFVTKVRPGSISEAIKNKLEELGFVVITPDDNWDIREGYPFPDDCQVMVNTAGVTDTAKPGEWGWEKANKVISVNLTGAAVLTSDFVKATAGTPWVKTIIHLGSLWSRKACYKRCHILCQQGRFGTLCSLHGLRPEPTSSRRIYHCGASPRQRMGNTIDQESAG